MIDNLLYNALNRLKESHMHSFFYRGRLDYPHNNNNTYRMKLIPSYSHYSRESLATAVFNNDGTWSAKLTNGSILPIPKEDYTCIGRFIIYSRPDNPYYGVNIKRKVKVTPVTEKDFRLKELSWSRLKERLKLKGDIITTDNLTKVFKIISTEDDSNY